MNSKKVLLVEDTRSLALALKHMIEETHRLQVDVFGDLSSTEISLNKKAEDYCVAIVDYDLPDAHHGEAVDVVIKNKIPCILFTGMNDGSIQEEDLWEKGIADYAHKSMDHSLEYVAWMVGRINNNALVDVLVVDDSSVARNSMARLLKIQQLNVFKAGSGEEALDIIRDNPQIKVVIIDCYMEGMDGMKLTSKIRESHKKNEMEIIGVSSQGGQKLSTRFIKSGANDFLLKPFTPGEFLCRVNHSIDNIEMYSELKKLNHLKNQFIGTAAHDIRGPLGAIQTSASYMLTRDLPEKKAEKLLQLINRSSKELIELLNNLLDVSAIESGSVELNLIEADVTEILNERVELYTTSIDAKEIKLQSEFEPVNASIDLIKFKQLLDNLLSNAIKFVPKKGRIFLKLYQSDINAKKAFVFEVHDSGSGVEEEEIKLLFNPFTTLSSRSTTSEKQTGLGLVIARKVCKAHNGSLIYQHSELGGACFKVKIPVSQFN